MQVVSALSGWIPLEESAHCRCQAGDGDLEDYPAFGHAGHFLWRAAHLDQFTGALRSPVHSGVFPGHLYFCHRIYAVIARSGGSFEGIRQGAALSILLVAVVALALWIQQRVLRSGGYDIIKGKSMRPTVINLRGARIPLFILALTTLVVIVLVPLGMIFLVALVRAYGLPLIPANFTLANYQRIFTASGTLESIKNSMILSLSAGVITMLLGTMVAYVVQKIRPRGSSVLEIMSVLPYSIPGTVLAIGVILAWSGSLGLNLYNTLWIILVAYIARYLSFSMKTSSAALLQVHPSWRKRPAPVGHRTRRASGTSLCP